MGKSAAKLPLIPLVHVTGVADPNLRILLQAVVDGWYMRNGVRGGRKAIEFITLEDIRSDPDLRAQLRDALGIV